MWTRHSQQQQRGAQMPARDSGKAPAEAVEGRSAQQHDEADQQVAPDNVPPAIYPAGRLQDEQGDNTPSAPDPEDEVDDPFQPSARDEDLPLPAAVSRQPAQTELEEDGRGDDAEVTVVQEEGQETGRVSGEFGDRND